MRQKLLVALTIILITFTFGVPALAQTDSYDLFADSNDYAIKSLESYGKLPIVFIQNQGQLDERVKYYAKTAKQLIYLTQERIVFDYTRYEGEQQAEVSGKKASRLVFSLEFIDANSSPIMLGIGKDDAIVNYLIGNDPERWQINIPTYKEVVYRSIYPGIDLRLYNKEGQLEYEFIVEEGANVNDIVLAYDGVDSLTIESEELVVRTPFGDFRQTSPFIYQQIGGRKVE